MPNVAFCRPLVPGKKGKDVIAHKRAISRAAPDLYPWLGDKFTPFYGERFEEAVKKYQRRVGIKPASGDIGKATHELLENKRAKNKPSEYAFDPYSRRIAAEFCEEFVKTSREEVVDAGFYWYSKRFSIDYSQWRPYQKGVPLWFPDRWDCSGFVTVCYYAGGVNDPNGRGYDGLGYTGTLMSRGERVSKSQMKPADLIFYGFNRTPRPGFGWGAPTHVAMYVGNDMVLSLGSSPMGHYRYDYRSDINHFRTYSI